MSMIHIKTAIQKSVKKGAKNVSIIIKANFATGKKHIFR